MKKLRLEKVVDWEINDLLMIVSWLLGILALISIGAALWYHSFDNIFSLACNGYIIFFGLPFVIHSWLTDRKVTWEEIR